MADAARTPEREEHDERVETHAGQLVPKEAAKFEHSDAQGGIAVAVRGPFQRRPGAGGPGGWWIATEGEVAYPGWTFLHDLAGWRRERLADKPSGRPVREPPDWVCEILSTNRRHDVVTKFEVLATAGVGHYWLVDPDARELVVHRLEAGRWVRVAAFVASEPGLRARVEPFEAVELEVAVLFGDDPS
ncbi:MAG: Uma2 family endonuclease [Sandaracinaceae bacterium]|nr:Uma2 family endonuclease [Sandaracinaceae bacterium]